MRKSEHGNVPDGGLSEAARRRQREDRARTIMLLSGAAAVLLSFERPNYLHAALTGLSCCWAFTVPYATGFPLHHMFTPRRFHAFIRRGGLQMTGTMKLMTLAMWVIVLLSLYVGKMG